MPSCSLSKPLQGWHCELVGILIAGRGDYGGQEQGRGDGTNGPAAVKCVGKTNGQVEIGQRVWCEGRTGGKKVCWKGCLGAGGHV